MENLKSQPMPPYFLSCEIRESRSVSVRGAFGTILSSAESHSRLLDIDLRIGDPTFDNTHPIRGGSQFFDFSDRFSFASVVLEDNPAAIRQILWYQTDKTYKQDLGRYTHAKANAQVKVAPEDASGGFSKEPPEKFSEAPVEVKVNRSAWEQRVRKYTAPFAATQGVYDGEATLSVSGEPRCYVNSDGSELQTSSAYDRLILSA
jgi:hypothetical protein